MHIVQLLFGVQFSGLFLAALVSLGIATWESFDCNYTLTVIPAVRPTQHSYHCSCDARQTYSKLTGFVRRGMFRPTCLLYVWSVLYVSTCSVILNHGDEHRLCYNNSLQCCTAVRPPTFAYFRDTETRVRNVV